MKKVIRSTAQTEFKGPVVDLLKEIQYRLQQLENGRPEVAGGCLASPSKSPPWDNATPINAGSKVSLSQAVLDDLSRIAERLASCNARSEIIADRIFGSRPASPTNSANPEPNCLVSKFGAVISSLQHYTSNIEEQLDRIGEL